MAAERTGAPAQIRLRELSIFITPPKGFLMAAIRGWLDDSRREAIWSVGGYIGGDFQWEYFEEHWPKALEAVGVSHFHMKETAKPTGIYSKWHPPQEHKEEWAAFYASLVSVISDSHIFGILSVVRGGDLDRFNQERKLALELYPLAAYGCMLLSVRQNIPGLPIQLIFDRVEKVQAKLATAQSYAESDKHWCPGECDFVTVSGLGKGVPLQQLPAMQAADFVAWEFRKHQERINEWHELGEVPSDADEAWSQLEQWIFEKYGSHENAARKSAAALIEPQRFANLVWDYRTLNEVHDLRGGLWT
ncbi:MAG: hypothetical protein WB760_17980 [Xanthobacteraceae bacterium]